MNCIMFQRLTVILLVVTTTGFTKTGMVQRPHTSRAAPASVDQPGCCAQPTLNNNASEDLDGETATRTEKEAWAQTRQDLNAETAVHIEQEVLAQTKQEEVEFLQELVEQVNQLKSGSVRDTMEAENAKGEVRRVRDLLAEKAARIAALEGELAILRADKMRLSAENSDMSLRLDQMTSEHARKLTELQQNIEALMAQLSELIDAKMSLELEIACYKKLLEGEENRTGLRQLVEQTIGIGGGGASQLVDIIGGGQSSSQIGGSSGSMTARMEIQKTRTGAVGIKGADQTGGCIEVEVDGGARSGQELKNMKLVKKVNGKETMSVDLSQCELGRLEPGKCLKIWASGAKSKADNMFDYIVPNQFTFGIGAGDIFLYDGPREVARLSMRQTR